jgi:hypothetical protein
MLKNFSVEISQSTLVARSILAKTNSLAWFSDCPTAKATEFPSGENALSPILIGFGLEASIFSFFPLIESANHKEQFSSLR